MRQKWSMIAVILNIISVSGRTSSSEDESDVGIEIDFTTKLSITDQIVESTSQVNDEKWTSMALKNIAHYLRNYKFNEWDQRYYLEKPSDDLIGYYDAFPIPILRTLHWKVFENCDSDFYKCISYLQSVIETAPFSRSDDVITILNQRAVDNTTLIKNLDKECKKSRLNSERSSLPFDSPTEKFQWRTTASYYMCWYTMLGTPVLSMLGDTCDNFANCLDPAFGHRNHDPRSDDKLSFACAMYSFCPDPCCPLKHISYEQECRDSIHNPCYSENNNLNPANRQCSLDKKLNRNLNDIIGNKWNVTCNCKKPGFTWTSQFGMCVDINECLFEDNVCDDESEDCLNIPGSFKCICKWGFEFDKLSKRCVRNDFFMENNDNLKSKSFNNSKVIWLGTRILKFIGLIN